MAELFREDEELQSPAVGRLLGSDLHPARVRGPRLRQHEFGVDRFCFLLAKLPN
jgi:hypothetical protein